MAILVAIIVSGFQPLESMRPEVISGLILKQHEQLSGLSLDYEGRFDHPPYDESSGVGSEFASFTGTFSTRAEKQAIRLDLYYLYPHQEITSNNFQKVIVTIGGKTTAVAESHDGRKGASIEATDEHDFDSSGSFGQVLPINQARLMFSSPTTVTRYEGTDTVDGHLCHKIGFHFAKGPPAAGRSDLLERWWFDLGRGGHVLRREYYWSRNRPFSVLRDVKLRKYQFGSREIWVPVDGISESLDDAGAPTGREFFHVNQNTVTLKQLGDDHFKAKIKPGTHIKDELLRREYEYGQDIRPPELSHEEAEQRVREQLAAADQQKQELNASRTANTGSDYTYVGLLASASVLAAFVVLQLLRHRRHNLGGRNG